MRAVVLAFSLASFIVPLCKAQVKSELKSLYEAHKWKELAARIQGAEGVPLFRGAIGVTFNQDEERTERILQGVISAAPNSPDAYDAAEWLSHLYFYRGQYRRLISVMEKRWADFPEKKANAEEKGALAGFRGLPDQTVVSSRPSRLAHEPGSIFMTVRIDGRPATYFFDTGAWVSCMSESEAKRLHLQIRNNAGTMGQSAGAQVSFRTAVAQDVTVGNTRFKDVSFAVFPDNQEPWSDLAPGRKGIIGVPLLVGIQTLRWEEHGLIELANSPAPFNLREANLAFEDDHLAVTTMIQGQEVKATVDTGATRTDLYKPFAEKFEDLLKRDGKKDSTEVHGVGHAEKFESVTLPELRIQIGGSTAVLSPAHVLMKSIGASCCLCNFGMDIFQQARTLDIDFRAMTLRLL
jgi:predicted aspartyl protease